ncbi:MAG TPA: hemolysin family protein [Methylomirabilota bacterium]|jgi:CBS domain containing-hemolysin-like protein|nr:hemolysin family protein [Methylomirabilota bacterium]
MVDRLILDLLLLFGFLVVSGLLAGAEAAYFSLGRLGATADSDDPRASPLLTRLLAKPHDLLITILVGITVVNIAASALATSLAATAFGPRGVGVAIPVMIFLIVVFGEVLPMTVAVDSPRRFGLAAAYPVLALAYVLTPVRAVLGAFTAVITHVVAREETPQTAITEAELRTLVEVGHREGVVERTEREMIHGVFELGDTTVWDIMTPRTDVFGVDVAAPPEQLLPELRAHLHHRVPVYDGSLDNVVGILFTKDLLPYYRGLPPDFQLRPLLRPAYFVPQTKRADALLREFQAKKLRTAIVVDEYGGTAGLVTLEDILEEVVGEIRDEFESEERLAQPVDARSWRVAAKMPIAEFNALIGLGISDETFDTVGGWVLDLFGRVPHRGESIESGGVRVTVEKLHRTRILEVLVRLPAPPPSPAPAEPAP